MIDDNNNATKLSKIEQVEALPEDRKYFNFKPNERQILLAKLITDFDDKRTITEKARSIGIPHNTLVNWMARSGYIAYINDQLPIITAAHKAAVWAKTIEKAVGGDNTCIRLYFELQGDTEKHKKPTNATQININLTNDKNQTLLDKANRINLRLPDYVVKELEKETKDK